MTNTNDMREAFGDLARELAEARAESVEPVEQTQQAQVPDEAFNIIEGIRAEITWGGWRSAYSRDWVMNRLSELLSMLTASPAPDHPADVRKMVAQDASELEKAAQKLWRESYSCESDFIQAVVDAFSKKEETER